MAVKGALRAVLGHDVAEARHELREMLGVDRRILDERDGLGLPLHSQEEPEPGLAQLPDGLLLAGVVGDVGGVAETVPPAPRLESLDLRLHLGVALARVLDDEDRGGVALHESHALALLDVPPGRSRIILSVSSTA